MEMRPLNHPQSSSSSSSSSSTSSSSFLPPKRSPSVSPGPSPLSFQQQQQEQSQTERQRQNSHPSSSKYQHSAPLPSSATFPTIQHSHSYSNATPPGAGNGERLPPIKLYNPPPSSSYKQHKRRISHPLPQPLHSPSFTSPSTSTFSFNHNGNNSSSSPLPPPSPRLSPNTRSLSSPSLSWIVTACLPSPKKAVFYITAGVLAYLLFYLRNSLGGKAMGGDQSRSFGHDRQKGGGGKFGVGVGEMGDRIGGDGTDTGNQLGIGGGRGGGGPSWFGMGKSAKQEFEYEERAVHSSWFSPWSHHYHFSSSSNPSSPSSSDGPASSSGSSWFDTITHILNPFSSHSSQSTNGNPYSYTTNNKHPSPYLSPSSPYPPWSPQSLPPELLEFKQWEFSRALVYEGTGARIQRFLEKARRVERGESHGRGLVVGVVGGSVSKGRGLRSFGEGEEGKKEGGGDGDDFWNGDGEGEGKGDGEVGPGEGTDVRRDGNGYVEKRSFQEDLISRNGTGNQARNERNPRSTGQSFPIPPSSLSRNLYNPLNLHSQIFDFLNTTFPVRSSSKKGGGDEKGNRNRNVLINGAQGGTSSEYFAGCWKEHVPEDSDLVLVELGINDLRDFASMEAYELLIRSLLEMPSQPAILNIQTFTLLFPTLSQASSLHLDVAAYYDTPVISIRDVLLPRILNQGNSYSKRTGSGASRPREKRNGLDMPPLMSRRDTEETELALIKRGFEDGNEAGGEERRQEKRAPREAAEEIRKWFRNVEGSNKGDAKVVGNVDLMHISESSHALIAELVIHYLHLQIARLDPKEDFYLEEGWGEDMSTDDELEEGDLRWSERADQWGGVDEELGATDVPGMLLAGHYTPNKRIRRSDPFCRSTNSAFEERRLEPGPKSHGWNKWSWGEKNYITSNTPGSLFSLEFRTHARSAIYDSEADQRVVKEEEKLAAEFASDSDDLEKGSSASESESARGGKPSNVRTARRGIEYGNATYIPGEGEEKDGSSNVLDKRRPRKVGLGYVKIGYQRSATYGLGSVECWVDERSRPEDKVRVDGWWDIKERNMGMITTIRDDLLPGRHTLSCVLLDKTLDPGGGKEFRFISVLYD